MGIFSVLAPLLTVGSAAFGAKPLTAALLSAGGGALAANEAAQERDRRMRRAQLLEAEQSRYLPYGAKFVTKAPQVDLSQSTAGDIFAGAAGGALGGLKYGEYYKKMRGEQDKADYDILAKILEEQVQGPQKQNLFQKARRYGIGSPAQNPDWE